MEIRKNKFHGYLRDDKISSFNNEVKNLAEPVDLENCNLRGLDLKNVILKNANLKHSYLKLADLRGVDLSNAQLEGATINHARVSGVLFPKNITAEEIKLSLEFGTRIRTTDN